MGVSVRNLALHYGKKVILENISFDLFDEEIIALFGPSGVGKTSLLKMIAGIQPVKKGSIQFNGNDSQADTVLVFQDFWLFPHMTVSENIAFGLKARKFAKSVINQKIAQMISVFDLIGLENQYPDQLSGGQKQRVALARAIVLEPKLLLLDEPFANLDSHLKDSMRQYLIALKKKYHFGIIMVTHDREEAFQLADRMIMLLDGQLKQDASPEEIYRSPKNQQIAKAIGEYNFVKGTIRNNSFYLNGEEIQISNPEAINNQSMLYIPSNTKIKCAESGIPCKIKSVDWTPNGQRVQAEIAGTRCLLTNLSLQPKVEEVLLRFEEPLLVVNP